MPAVELHGTATWQSITGHQLSLDELQHEIEKHNPYDMLTYLNEVALSLKPGIGSELGDHIRMAQKFMSPAYFCITIGRVLQEGHRGIFDFYGLTILSAWMIRNGDERIPFGQLNKHSFSRLLLAVHDITRPTLLREDNHTKAQMDEALIQYSLKRLAHPHPQHLVYELSRFYRLFRVISAKVSFPVELAQNFDEFLTETLHRTANEHFSCMMMLFINFVKMNESEQGLRSPVLVPKEWFKNVQRQEVILKFLSQLSLSLHEYSVEFKRTDKSDDPKDWSLRTIYQYPFLQFNEVYLLVSPVSLYDKATVGLYYDLVNKLEGKGRNRYTSWLGDCFQMYCEELVSSTFSVVIRSPKYGKNKEITDIVIVIDDTWILLECKWHFWSLKMQSEGIFSQSDEEQILLKPFKQLSAAASLLLKDSNLIGMPKPPSRIIPLILANVALPEVSTVRYLLDEQWKSYKESFPPIVERPRILSIQEMEKIAEAPNQFVQALDNWRVQSLSGESTSMMKCINDLLPESADFSSYVREGWEALTKEMTLLIKSWDIAKP